MAIFRKIHTSFWSDSFTSELDKDKKLFYLYLLTNERTTQCGIYEITKKQISFDLSYSIDTVSKLLDYFVKNGKILYNEKTNEVAIRNWKKYNFSTSPKVQSCINKELTKVKDTLLIQYINSIDTYPQEEEEEEQEQEEEKNKDDFSFKKSLISLGIETQIVIDWMKVRKLKKATNTETSFERIKNQIELSGKTANECIKIAVERDWKGFEAEWLKNTKPFEKAKPNMYLSPEQDYSTKF
jgi:hypothetical protein